MLFEPSYHLECLILITKVCSEHKLIASEISNRIPELKTLSYHAHNIHSNDMLAGRTN